MYSVKIVSDKAVIVCCGDDCVEIVAGPRGLAVRGAPPPPDDDSGRMPSSDPPGGPSSGGGGNPGGSGGAPPPPKDTYIFTPPGGGWHTGYAVRDQLSQLSDLALTLQAAPSIKTVLFPVEVTDRIDLHDLRVAKDFANDFGVDVVLKLR